MNKYNLNKDEIINNLGFDDKTKNYIKRNLIFLTVSGSHAYGMNTKESDIDIRGIFIGEKEDIIGNNRIEQFQDSKNDITIYEFKKAINLIAEQNPNMMELLFVDKEEIIFATSEYWYIREQRNNFLSSLSKQKYSGYAMSQLKRIKGHDKWLTKEKSGKFDKKPKMIDYCKVIDFNGETIKDIEKIKSYSKNTILTHLSNSVFKIWKTTSQVKSERDWFDNKNYTFRFTQNLNKMKSIFIGILFFAKDEFTNDLKEYSDWKNWKENRNEKRHKLEEKYNFDTKHGSHLVRLLRMGYEILSQKKVLVKRPDARELLDIRNGKWSYEKIIKYAEKMDKEILEEAYKNTKLSRSVDKNFVNELLLNIYDVFWKNKIIKTKREYYE